MILNFTQISFSDFLDFSEFCKDVKRTVIQKMVDFTLEYSIKQSQSILNSCLIIGGIF